MPSEPRKSTVIEGDRFVAQVSGNRSVLDIADKRITGKLALLKANDLRELRDLAQNALEFMGEA